MAVSIDTVYQRVLALANKEQRGYITPQEFNLLANQAQMSIFESYFYAKNQRDKIDPDPDHHTSESNIGKLIDEKLKPFGSFETVTSGTTFPTTVGVGSPAVNYDIFQYGNIVVNNRFICKYMERTELENMLRSTRHMTYAYDWDPIWTDSMTGSEDIEVYGNSGTQLTSNITVECFRIPVTANWAYVVVNDVALYNSNLAVDFELHRSEEDTLVYNILQLAGIVINKPGLATLATQKLDQETQTQKV